MTISENGLKLIEGFEGCILHPYHDKVGKPTIGFGNTCYENGTAVKMSDPHITRDRADGLLKHDAMAKAYILAQTLQKNHMVLNQNQFDSLCSFSYNSGIYGLLRSTLFGLIKQGARTADILRPHFMEWNKGHVNGKLVVIEDLTARRKKEADLFFTPIPNS